MKEVISDRGKIREMSSEELHELFVSMYSAGHPVNVSNAWLICRNYAQLTGLTPRAAFIYLRGFTNYPATYAI